MEDNHWREIHNATADYLAWRKSFTIVTTRLKNPKSKTYQAMLAWCQENVEGSWGPGYRHEYDGYITWRFWRGHEAELFCKKFKRYIQNQQNKSY